MKIGDTRGLKRSRLWLRATNSGSMKLIAGTAFACAGAPLTRRDRRWLSPTAARMAPTAVIWATGFAVDHSFVQVPVFDDAARLMHHRGVTAAPGLYFLGLTWQHTRGSALLGWVKDDAEFIAARIAAHAEGKPAAAVAQAATGSGRRAERRTSAAGCARAALRPRRTPPSSGNRGDRAPCRRSEHTRTRYRSPCNARVHRGSRSRSWLGRFTRAPSARVQPTASPGRSGSAVALPLVTAVCCRSEPQPDARASAGGPRRPRSTSPGAFHGHRARDGR
jgi:hypothetical protein